MLNGCSMAILLFLFKMYQNVIFPSCFWLFSHVFSTSLRSTAPENGLQVSHACKAAVEQAWNVDRGTGCLSENLGECYVWMCKLGPPGDHYRIYRYVYISVYKYIYIYILNDIDISKLQG